MEIPVEPVAPFIDLSSSTEDAGSLAAGACPSPGKARDGSPLDRRIGQGRTNLPAHQPVTPSLAGAEGMPRISNPKECIATGAEAVDIAANPKRQVGRVQWPMVTYYGCFLLLWVVSVYVLLEFGLTSADIVKSSWAPGTGSPDRPGAGTSDLVSGDSMLLISFLLATCAFGLVFLTLAMSLRKRNLMLWEVSNYVAATGATLATLRCFRLHMHRVGDFVAMYYEVSWFPLLLCYVFLAPTLFLMYVQARS
jgi:hypothetical protein